MARPSTGMAPLRFSDFVWFPEASLLLSVLWWWLCVFLWVFTRVVILVAFSQPILYYVLTSLHRGLVQVS